MDSEKVAETLIETAQHEHDEEEMSAKKLHATEIDERADSATDDDIEKAEQELKFEGDANV